MIISEHLSWRVVIVIVTGHYNCFYCIISIDFSHLRCCKLYFWAHQHYKNFSCLTVFQEVWFRNMLQHIFIYILCFTCSSFIYWHKQLKLAVQSVWKELTGGKLHLVESVFVEGRNICDCISSVFTSVWRDEFPTSE